MQPRSARWTTLRSAFAFAGALLLVTCTQTTTPTRRFTAMQLLIELSDMPPGWQVENGPGTLRDHLYGVEAAKIGFSTRTDSQERTAAQRVYRYSSSTKARRVYDKMVLPAQVGETPPEWTYHSSVADQSHFACYDYEGRRPVVCQWSGRYEEYVVIFQSYLLPEQMSLDHMEQVVSIIDARMGQYLNESPESISDAR